MDIEGLLGIRCQRCCIVYLQYELGGWGGGSYCLKGVREKEGSGEPPWLRA